MRTLCISDIHGQYDAFCRLLDTIQYSPISDQLILLGDFIDGGPHGRQVVDKVIELSREGSIAAIRGNHEEAFLAWLHGELPEYTKDYKALPTLKDYIGETIENSGEKKAAQTNSGRLCSSRRMDEEVALLLRNSNTYFRACRN